MILSILVAIAAAAPVKTAFIGDVEGMSKGAVKMHMLNNPNAEVWECKLYQATREDIKAKGKGVFVTKRPAEVSILEAQRAFAAGKLAGECTQKVLENDAKIKNF